MALRSHVTRAKAKTILREGSIRGHALTGRQKRFFGARAGGASEKQVAR